MKYSGKINLASQNDKFVKLQAVIRCFERASIVKKRPLAKHVHDLLVAIRG